MSLMYCMNKGMTSLAHMMDKDTCSPLTSYSNKTDQARAAAHTDVISVCGQTLHSPSPDRSDIIS